MKNDGIHKIKYVKGDILKLLEEYKDKSVILFHQCNCFCTLGRARGLAGILDKEFPQIVVADHKTIKGDKNKLGSYTYAIIHNKLTIVNLYGQYDYGMNPNKIYTDYWALDISFNKSLDELLKNYDEKPYLFIPYNIGSGLANGDRNIIHKNIFLKRLVSIYTKMPNYNVIFFYN